MTNEELVNAIRNSDGETRRALMGDLYSQNTGLIRSTAAPYIRAGMAEDDAMQEGYLALVQAIEGYDESKGAFSTYFPYWIRATIARAYDGGHIKRLPAWVQTLARQYEVFTADFLREYGTPPDDASYRAVLHIPQEKLDKLRQVMREVETFSLSDPIPGADGVTYADMVRDPADAIEDAIDAADRQQAARDIWAAVDRLQDAQPDVLRIRYQEQQSIRATAERLGMTPGRVEREEQKGLRRLRTNKKIKLIANDYGYSTSQLYGGSLQAFKHTFTSNVEAAVIKHNEAVTEHIKHLQKEG